MVDTPADNGVIRVTVKELFADINRSIEALSKNLTEALKDHESRLSRQEQRNQRADELQSRFLKLESDFPGFVSRVDHHIESQGHPDILARVVKLETEMERILIDKEVQDSIKAHMAKAAEARKWIIGLAVSNFVALVIGLVKLFFF